MTDVLCRDYPGYSAPMAVDHARTTQPAGGASDRSGAGPMPSRLPGLLLGMGYGGFIDGILLHQILQWHHMVSDTEDGAMDTVAGLEANTLADGLFHAATWVLLFAGMVLTVSAWRRGRLAPSWRFQGGLLLVGWGLFNLVEGIVDHHILQVHHVRDDLGGPLSWDLGFLASGALLVLVGWGLHRSGRREMVDVADHR